MSQKTAITPTREQDYPEWYQQVITAADMAENSPARGCMVIKPWGYAIWENIQRVLDKRFKETGHKNAYFPIFIPMSFIEREAAHVAGFAKECAVVTHHRLERGTDGKLHPAGELTEPYIVRPTSETIIGEMFSKWVQSYRDLPLLINQWANVVRWEMRPRLFLRTAEFLWQEGHTVHATKEDAMRETMMMLDVYADFCENYMAMPVIKGEKTESERFPGAESTFCIEAMMQDRKALQSGTSHFLGQNFSRASNIKFLDESGKEVLAWTTSWGVSTRLIGGLIMTHADDDGMIVPPKLAPLHVVIVPIIHKDEVRQKIIDYSNSLCNEIKNINYDGIPVSAEVDTRNMNGGEKVWSWIKKGVPLRIEIGPREADANNVFVGRRDKAHKEKFVMPKDEFLQHLPDLLDDIQSSLFKRALEFRKSNKREIDDIKEFYKFFTSKDQEKPEIHGGFALSHWCGDYDIEKKLKDELNVTIRCIPLIEKVPGKCLFTGKPSPQRVIFAKAY